MWRKPCIWFDDNSWMHFLQLEIATIFPEFDWHFDVKKWALTLADVLAAEVLTNFCTGKSNWLGTVDEGCQVWLNDQYAGGFDFDTQKDPGSWHKLINPNYICISFELLPVVFRFDEQIIIRDIFRIGHVPQHFTAVAAPMIDFVAKENPGRPRIVTTRQQPRHPAGRTMQINVFAADLSWEKNDVAVVQVLAGQRSKPFDVLPIRCHRQPDAPVVAGPGLETVVIRYKVIYEEGELLVVNKGGKLPCHLVGAFKKNSDTICRRNTDRLRSSTVWTAKTSGLLIAARNSPSTAAQGAQLQDGRMEKTYHALVFGKLAESFTAEGYLSNDPGSVICKKRRFKEFQPEDESEYVVTDFIR